jgi:uncharacterized protein YdeI (YjbR/CyaY-like superfamily)
MEAGFMRERSEGIRFEDRRAWRAWLEENGASEMEVWLTFAKAGRQAPGGEGRRGLRLRDAVEDALCFGWIDSTLRSLASDAYTYILRFTPRRNIYNWSAPNLRSVRKLQADGRMTKAGLAKIGPGLLDREPPPGPQGLGVPVPSEMAEALRQNPQAQQNFDRMPVSHRYQYIRWISDAKREDTRQRRLAALVARLAWNKVEHAKRLDEKDHRSLALWAADCAEHVLPHFEEEYPKDDRPRKALEAVRAWVRGEIAMGEARAAALAAHAAARDADHAAARTAARAAGHAAATAHVAGHARHAAAYAVTAASAVSATERDWQYLRLPEHLRPIVFPAPGNG